MIKNANHLPLNLLQYENERFRVRVKNLRRRLWLFKTWAFGDSGIRITNPSIAVRDCKSRTVGEVSRIMVRTYGEQSLKKKEESKNLADEMADVLWVLTALANQRGVDLESAMKKNFEKKTLRDADRHLSNPKLDNK